MLDFLREHAFFVWKRRKLAGIFMLAVLVFTTLLTLKQERVYRATTSVEIGTETPDAVFVNDVVNSTAYGWWSAMRYYETQYQIIRSRDLIEIVVKEAIKRGFFKSDTDVGTMAASMQRRVKVTADDNSRLAYIHFDDTNPEFAQKMCILLAEVYAEQNLARKLEGVQDAVNWLNARLSEIQQEKNEQEQELENFRREYKIVSLKDHDSMSRANLDALSKEYSDLRAKRIEYQAQFQRLSSLIQKKSAVGDLLGIVSNELLETLNRDLAQLKAEKSKLKTRYLAKHPRMLQLDSQISEIQKLIQKEVQNEVARLETRYLLAKAEEDSVANALDELKLSILKIDKVNRKLRDIEIVTNTNQEVYETIQKRLKEADLSSLIRSNSIRVVDRALLPTRPIRPDILKNMALALLLGLLGGIGLAILFEYLDDHVASVDDLEVMFNEKVMGVIPKQDMAELEGEEGILCVPHHRPTLPVSEFYRTLRTNVSVTFANSCRTLLVTSTQPSEGKTVTALNLATTFAQTGEQVLIIDMDLRKPRVHAVFDETLEPGLTNFFLDHQPLDDLIRPTYVPNLFFIPAGSRIQTPAELFAKFNFDEFLNKHLAKFDRIIIDASPVAPVTDSVIAAQHVDAVLFVVRSNLTSRKTLRMGMKQLRMADVKQVGLVLNDFDVTRSHYSSYQYYRYGYGEQVDQKAS